MLLILEIILTIVAWKRGWKSMALIPVGVVFCIGLIVGATGATAATIASLIIFDVICVIILIVMSITGKNNS